jgi:D-amino-acid dehydrogenase
VPGSEAGKVIVIGGGIVGIASAAALVEAGRPVVLVERGGIGEGCSAGNSGLIAESGCVPHALPGILTRLPGLILRRSGPLTIRPGHALASLPWFMAMLRAARLPAVRHIAATLAAMQKGAKRATRGLALAAGCPGLIRDGGTIYVYDDEASFAHARLANELRRENGVALEVLDAGALREVEPNAPGIFRHGVLVPGNAFCTDPEAFSKAVGRLVEARGGRIVRATVQAIQAESRGVRVHTDTAGTLEAEVAVVAAGAWSPDLVRPLGARLQIAPHRGYHVMVPGAGDRLGYPLLWENKGFAIVPMEGGLRAAGTVEIAPADAPPDWRRSDRIARELARAMPDLDLSQASRWMGVRPATPDSLPCLGRLPGRQNVLVAAGHNHLGFSLAAVTGEAVRDLILDRPPAFDVVPLAVDRFDRRGTDSTSLHTAAEVR